MDREILIYLDDDVFEWIWYFIIINQSSNWLNKAVPLSVQNSAAKCFVGKSTGKIKFVLCPVVDNTPALFDVL